MDFAFVFTKRNTGKQKRNIKINHPASLRYSRKGCQKAAATGSAPKAKFRVLSTAYCGEF
jgi:hypothetical protein